MSDFLAVFDPHTHGNDLLTTLRQPHAGRPVGGHAMDYSWGAIAVLDQPGSSKDHIIPLRGLTMAWVGDLVWPGGTGTLRQTLTELPFPPLSTAMPAWLRKLPLLRKINGAAALVLATDHTLCIITDPMSAVQVYAGTDATGQIRAIGTHPDLVAVCASPELQVDPVSVADFLNTGTPCCPHTMHCHVRELSPGTAHLFGKHEGGPMTPLEQITYWTPPDEISGSVDENELAREFGDSWTAAVRDRCAPELMGVQLSGGLDSRLIVAALPPETQCVSLTYVDHLNREARIARRVSECYGRPWKMLKRNPEYVADTALDAIRFTGCEGEWHHAHAIGFGSDIAQLGVSSVFTGLYMDNNFKGYYAKDLTRRNRLGGLLPPRFVRRQRDYVDRVNGFCREVLKPEILGACLDRRRQFQEAHFALTRSSAWEWLDGFPLTQASDNTGWIVERRFLPMRLPVMDRRLVDLAFRIPARIKAGGGFFVRAAAPILGPGAAIVNANDGVRPMRNHLGRLFERSLRKIQDSGRRSLARAGVNVGVPHSWHDYQDYWRNSPALAALKDQYEAELESVAAPSANINLRTYLRQPDLPWRIGCRIVQLAAWHSLARQYRLETNSNRVPVPANA